MSYLQQLDEQPDPDELSARDVQSLHRRFEADSRELSIYDQVIPWEAVGAVEVAVAPRMSGPAGWLVRQFLHSGGDRYHVGIYTTDDEEAVLPNVTWETARFVVRTIAFFAPGPVAYTGPDDVAQLTEP